LFGALLDHRVVHRVCNRHQAYEPKRCLFVKCIMRERERERERKKGTISPLASCFASSTSFARLGAALEAVSPPPLIGSCYASFFDFHNVKCDVNTHTEQHVGSDAKQSFTRQQSI
jgi:hypothetical protein